MAKKTPREAELRALNAGIAQALREALPPEVGFTLLTFDYGEGGGNLAYISSANREDMLKVLREMLGRLQERTN